MHRIAEEPSYKYLLDEEERVVCNSLTLSVKGSGMLSSPRPLCL